MRKKKVLVVGGGGREHAIVDALSRSPQVGTIYCAPGNAGIATMAECVRIKDTDVEALLNFAKEKRIDLTVVGPEAALAAGIADRFREEGLRIFGHSREAARIETSKEFAKEIMRKYGVPTAAYRSFSDYEEAREYVLGRPFPAVLKYDGLAAGKGVVIAENAAEAEEALKDMLLDTRFGKGKVVVEDFLSGPEFSFMCFVAGDRVWPMPLAQDHKRAFDGDKGPNTGGMGAYSPAPVVTSDKLPLIRDKIILPVVRELKRRGITYRGVLYAGLMVNDANAVPHGPTATSGSDVNVVEFNARFGDPETEAVLPRLGGSFATALLHAATGCLREEDVVVKDDCAATVILASGGYPGAYEKGKAIDGLGDLTQGARDESLVFHCGTKAEGGRIVTAGGRVLSVTGLGATLRAAVDNAYARIAGISFDGMFYRKDIAHRAFARG